MAAVAEPKGLKRICPSCGTRYYDLNKRPIICPGCTTEFKAEVKTKGRGRRLAAANDEPRAVVAPKVVEDDNTDVVEAEDGVVSLEEVEEIDEDDADDEIAALEPDLEVDADIEDLDEDDADDEDDEDDEEDEE